MFDDKNTVRSLAKASERVHVIVADAFLCWRRVNSFVGSYPRRASKYTLKLVFPAHCCLAPALVLARPDPRQLESAFQSALATASRL